MTTHSFSMLAIAVSVAVSATSLQAAEQATDVQADKNIEQISVLGSRVANRTATESSSPIDLIDADTLNKGGFTELGQSLQATAPSFNFSRTQVSDGSDLFRPATLRGLQPDQTLVLINGKRRHNQSIFGLNGTVGAGAAGTDMNAIPLSALKGVEVLRDGAAAQYGSDAIAGVINLSLNDSTGVTTGYVQAGSTGEGDGDTISIGLNRGFDLGDEGGFINFSAEYRNADGTNRAERDTGGSLDVPAGTLSDDVRWGQGNADSEFTSLFYNMALPLGDTELYSFGGYSNRTALGNGFYRNYNQAAKNVVQVYSDGFLPRIDNEAEDISFAVGLRGELNPDWGYDVSAVYGENSYDFTSKNTLNASYAAEYVANNPNASDADIAANAGPRGGYSGGFRFDQATVNADLNGVVNIGRSEPVYVSVGAEYRKENYQIVPGEEASYACGLANTDTSYPAVNDDSVFAECGFQAYNGLRPEASNKESRDSYAFYVNAETLLTDAWQVSTALRYEDFSDAGDDIIGKLATRYEISDDFAVRGAISSGFRAPSLQQSAYTAYTTNLGAGGVLLQSFTATAGSDFPSALGVDNLGLESSENLSAGFVYNVSSELSLTVDFYHVEIKDRITLGSLMSADDVAFSPAAVAALNATGAQQANYFSNSVDSTTKGVDIIASYRTDLYDGNFSATFAGNINDTEIDNVNAPEGIPESIALDDLQRSFLTDGQPGERATLTFEYDRGDFNSMLRFNYYGETDVKYFGNDHIGLPDELSPTGEFKDTSTVESAVLVDINVGYQLTDELMLSAGIDNIFDVTPDELGEDEALDFITNQAFKYPVRALPYGFDGMTYYAKLSFSF
ncbi:ligand-gated channel protein [Pseudoalteromonas lipolytica SCSIO 04301]|uniref:TonB-dependent receptor plug domain-containing protein n=1 Tax=Pseudoalteromonas TaxID=53246 RepID=UPI00044856B2|nr:MULTISPECIES: TonB-dependent receptor [Pseudoalteromonas]EWH05497.1 ligand-gated channel protein [Pseudoalteromonas lipolytica SCSIO 04301]MCC9660377.1 TonB-dependent receptor [Pseudoalteromonas sp. MB41]QLJ10235.1 TonB-dependent receptor [Pseudoalteromonas sp. JSTW]